MAPGMRCRPVNWFPPSSYDLELDTRLSEETTVLVESYTVSKVDP